MKKTQKSLPQERALALIQKLEKQRGTRTLDVSKLVKTLPAAQTILDAEPEVQIAIVQEVCAYFAELGAATGEKANYWWGRVDIWWGAGEIVRLLLRKNLPFTDAQFARLFVELHRIGLLVIPFSADLGKAFEKRAASQRISAKLRKVAARFADDILGRKLAPATAKLWEKTEWGPDAEERRVGTSIHRALAGSLDLN